MRPLFSVRHSPRLTNRNGVLTRIAPPSTAIGTPHQPSSTLVRSSCDLPTAKLRTTGKVDAMLVLSGQSWVAAGRS